MKKETDINIDALLRDVSDGGGTASGNHRASRYGAVSPLPAAGGTGPRTPERCRVQPGERGAHYLRAVRLLDETVLSRGGMDDGQAIWMKDPLQSHFFNTLQAGELLYERMKQVLQEPAPAQAVLTCFHRVLLLGFRGRYQDPVAPERDQVISTLNGLVAPFGVLPETAVLNVPLSPSASFAAFAVFLAGNADAATGRCLVGTAPLAERAGG